MGKFQNKVQIIPLGGLGEIGKNMTVFRYGDDMILIDAGLMFPEDDMLGIDLVIPDISYLIENQDKLKGIFLTHGHEDHIGALPYVMKQIDCPVYGTALTLGILQGRLKENGVSSENCRTIKPGDKISAGAFKLDFIRVNAQDRFLKALAGVTDPEQKRKIIGTEFVRVFEDESKKLPNVKFLAQGTIYPDVIESGGSKAATIKSHHNVGGLPKNMKFEGIVEPLRSLFKDEVRALGRQLGLPRKFVERQPFPGPGLAVRIMGEITPEKLEILREADAIFREEAARHRIKADQYFAVLTDTRSVGVVGDFRTYNYAIALRAVRTSDFMTCEYAPISHKVLGTVSSRIVNEVKGAGRVVYDITGKPPATIEWC